MREAIVIMLLLTTGCVSFVYPDYEITDVARDKERCVSLEFYDVSSSGGKPVIERLHPSDEQKLISKLKKLNVNTGCKNSDRNLKIEIEETNPVNVLDGVWASISFLSIGIVPYYHTEKLRINVVEGKTPLVTENIENKVAISLLYAKKMFTENRIAKDKFKMRTMPEVRNANIIAKVIRKALDLPK